MSYFVYILRTSGNTFYIGQTNDIEKRMEKHKSGKGAKYMRAFQSFELVYTEEFETKSEALRREYSLKQLSKKQKEELVNKFTRDSNWSF